MIIYYISIFTKYIFYLYIMEIPENNFEFFMNSSLRRINSLNKTPNNEKTILVAKCGCSNMDKAKSAALMAQFKIYIESQFNAKEFDDSLAILVIPSDEWDIEIYNPKTDEITKEYVEQLLEEYKEELKNNE